MVNEELFIAVTNGKKLFIALVTGSITFFIWNLCWRSPETFGYIKIVLYLVIGSLVCIYEGQQLVRDLKGILHDRRIFLILLSLFSTIKFVLPHSSFFLPILFGAFLMMRNLFRIQLWKGAWSSSMLWWMIILF